jgi:hypothetical protein
VTYASLRRRFCTQIKKQKQSTPSYDGVLSSLDAPNPCVMPGGKQGDGSPTTKGVRGHYSGKICTSSETPTPHGRGRMRWDNGITYEGSWRQGLYHGEGTKVFTNGGGYCGQWRKGLRHGKGASLYGGKWGYERWEGQFVDDLAHGHGTLFTSDGRELAFPFEQGELAGQPPCNEEYEKACIKIHQSMFIILTSRLLFLGGIFPALVTRDNGCHDAGNLGVFRAPGLLLCRHESRWCLVENW